MRVVITIDCDNEAFDGADCGSEIARILRPLADHLEFESNRTIARGYGATPKRLHDKNGNTVGDLAIFTKQGER